MLPPVNAESLLYSLLGASALACALLAGLCAMQLSRRRRAGRSEPRLLVGLLYLFGCLSAALLGALLLLLAIALGQV